MAKRTTRDRYKRKIEQAIGHCNTIENILTDMYHVYSPTELKIGGHLILLLEANEQLRAALERFNKTV